MQTCQKLVAAALVCYLIIPLATCRRRLKCRSPATVHATKEGISRCCVSRSVPRGYQPQLCYVSNDLVTLEHCPSETYQDGEHPSFEMVYCFRKRTCAGRTIAVTEGNRTHNRVCTCDISKGYFSPNGIHENPDYCLLKKCLNGTQLNADGNCTVPRKDPVVAGVMDQTSEQTSTNTPVPVWILVVGIIGSVVLLLVIILFLKKPWKNFGKCKESLQKVQQSQSLLKPSGTTCTVSPSDACSSGNGHSAKLQANGTRSKTQNIYIYGSAQIGDGNLQTTNTYTAGSSDDSSETYPDDVEVAVA